MYIFTQAFDIVIDHGISVKGHYREVVDDLNDTEKRFIFHLMANLHLNVSQWFEKKWQFTQQHIIQM